VIFERTLDPPKIQFLMFGSLLQSYVRLPYITAPHSSNLSPYRDFDRLHHGLFFFGSFPPPNRRLSGLVFAHNAFQRRFFWTLPFEALHVEKSPPNFAFSFVSHWIATGHLFPLRGIADLTLAFSCTLLPFVPLFFFLHPRTTDSLSFNGRLASWKIPLPLSSLFLLLFRRSEFSERSHQGSRIRMLLQPSLSNGPLPYTPQEQRAFLA